LTMLLPAAAKIPGCGEGEEGGNHARFLVLPYGMSWAEVTPESLLLMDASGRVHEGEGQPESTAFHIHARCKQRQLFTVMCTVTTTPSRCCPNHTARITRSFLLSNTSVVVSNAMVLYARMRLTHYSAVGLGLTVSFLQVSHGQTGPSCIVPYTHAVGHSALRRARRQAGNVFSGSALFIHFSHFSHFFTRV